MISYEEILQVFNDDMQELDSYIDRLIYEMIMQLIFD